MHGRRLVLNVAGAGRLVLAVLDAGRLVLASDAGGVVSSFVAEQVVDKCVNLCILSPLCQAIEYVDYSILILMAGSSVCAVADLEVGEVLCASLVGAFFVLVFFSSRILPSVFLISSCWPSELAVVLGVGVMPSVSRVAALRRVSSGAGVEATPEEVPLGA